MSLCTAPKKPRNDCLLDAHSILTRAIDSAQSFFEAFGAVRDNRGAKGTPTDHEQDLLRASLLFAAAGLDAVVKQLVRDALSIVISADKGAQQQFADYVQGRMARTVPLDIKYITQALLSRNPREYFESELVRELTGNSLQSKDQLLRVAAYFAIRADEISSDLPKLKVVFDARNQIAHEMDVLLGQVNRSRRSRAYDIMHDYTSFILATACAFYQRVEVKVGASANMPLQQSVVPQ
jgi:hypothetical protein